MNCAWKELLGILPQWMRPDVDRLGQGRLQQIRLRIGKPVQLELSTGRTSLPRTVSTEDLNYVVNTACRYSPWTAATAASGYLTAPGGHRIGLCGDAVMRDGHMTGLRTVRSLNIRVAGDYPGISRGLGNLKGSILILGRPGSGKTTLLRDLVRQFSETESVCVVDERGELFPMSCGVSCFDPGAGTDILSGCGKPQGIDAALRTMSPDTIAVDEITAAEDCRAMLQAGWCGVRLVATAHAASLRDLRSRPVYAPIAESGLFQHAVILQSDKSWRTERMEVCI